jgi:hypothetical protein
MKKEIEGYEFISTSAIGSWFSRLLNKAIMPQGFDIYCQTYSIYSVLLYCLNMDLLSKEKIFSLFATITQEKAKLFQKYFLEFHLEAFKILLSNGESKRPEKVSRTHTSKPKTKKQSESNSKSNSESINNFELLSSNSSQSSRTSRKGVSGKSKKKSNKAARKKSSNKSNSNNNFNLV